MRRVLLVSLLLAHLMQADDISAQEKIAVIGAGYVGLVVSACFAELGYHVKCVDIDTDKIALLSAGIVPIYENGLEELIRRNCKLNRLSYSTDIQQAVNDATIIFIAVGTPSLPDGSPDLSAVLNAADMIVSYADEYKMIIIKSTVPLGMNERLQSYFNENGCHCDVVSNPEFLRQGTAVSDFLNPERIVLGSISQEALKRAENLYEPIVKNGVPLIATDPITAETIKYASNSFLAIKLAYVNELDMVCDSLGADIHDLTRAMGLDSRIGCNYLKPGPGFGGSCLKKDARAFFHAALQHGVDLKMVHAAVESNEERKQYIIRTIDSLLAGDIKDKKIVLWGVAFKENTDDMRDAPSLVIVDALLNKGANVYAYDRQVTDFMKSTLPKVTFVDSLDKTLIDTDLVVILNMSDEVASYLAQCNKRSLKKPIIYNTRK